MHRCEWVLVAAAEDVGRCGDLSLVRSVFEKIDLADQFSENVAFTPGEAGAGEVVQVLNRVLILRDRGRDHLGHGEQELARLLVLVQGAEGELFSDILRIVGDAVLTCDHVEEDILVHRETHAGSEHVTDFGLDAIRLEFSLLRGDDRCGRVLARDRVVDRFKHVVDRGLNRDRVVVEDGEDRAGRTGDRLAHRHLGDDDRHIDLLDLDLGPGDDVDDASHREQRDDQDVVRIEREQHEEDDREYTRDRHARHPGGGDLGEDAEVDRAGTTGKAHTDHSTDQRVRGRDGDG